MKRIEFVSVWQLLVVSAFTLSAIVCFIGMFFNIFGKCNNGDCLIQRKELVT